MVVESRSQTMIDTTNTLRLHFLWLKYNLITSLSVKAFFAINLHNFTFSLATHGSEELKLDWKLPFWLRLQLSWFSNSFISLSPS